MNRSNTSAKSAKKTHWKLNYHQNRKMWYLTLPETIQYLTHCLLATKRRNGMKTLQQKSRKIPIKIPLNDYRIAGTKNSRCSILGQTNTQISGCTLSRQNCYTALLIPFFPIWKGSDIIAMILLWERVWRCASTHIGPQCLYGCICVFVKTTPFDTWYPNVIYIM